MWEGRESSKTARELNVAYERTLSCVQMQPPVLYIIAEARVGDICAMHSEGKGKPPKESCEFNTFQMEKLKKSRKNALFASFTERVSVIWREGKS